MLLFVFGDTDPTLHSLPSLLGQRSSLSKQPLANSNRLLLHFVALNMYSFRTRYFCMFGWFEILNLRIMTPELFVKVFIQILIT